MRTYTKVLTGIFMLFALFLSAAVSAQAILPVCSKPNGSTFLPKCVSQDLQVTGAFLTADQCFCSANQQVTATLNMNLFNKTGSTRTSFAFFAILVQTVNGVSTSSYITGCTGPVSPSSTSTISFPSQYTFTCGATLTLTNVYLAWTDASDHRDCPLDFCAISPKCGKPADIVITPLLTAVVSTTESCNNSPTGSITVTPSGGTSPYDIVIKSGATTVATYTDVTTAQTKTGLAAGSYTITVTDAATTPCVYTTSATVGGHPCCTNPPAPAVCQTPADICGDGTGSITLSGLQADAYYTVTQPNGYNETQQATGGVTTLTFTGITPGIGFTAHGEDRSSVPFCIGADATCANVTACAAGFASSTQAQTQSIKLPAP